MICVLVSAVAKIACIVMEHFRGLGGRLDSPDSLPRPRRTNGRFDHTESTRSLDSALNGAYMFDVTAKPIRDETAPFRTRIWHVLPSASPSARATPLQQKTPRAPPPPPPLRRPQLGHLGARRSAARAATAIGHGGEQPAWRGS